MTAEVAIMNKNALVLAADSATTVTSWASGRKETRFFKGANKLFQLSKVRPVGLMIYGSAAMHGVPWDIVIKEFRSQLGAEGCARLPTYSERFFGFVRDHAGLFPMEAKRQAFIDNAIRGMLLAVATVSNALEINHRNGVDLDTYRAVVEEEIENAKSISPPPPVTREDVESAVATQLRSVSDIAVAQSEILEIPHAEVASLIAELGIRYLMTNFKGYLDATGIVIGGYGENDYFPAFDVYECYGFLNGKLLATRLEDKCRAIQADEEAAIEPFATTSMINTFQMGIGPDVFGRVTEATKRCFLDFAESLRNRIAPGTSLPDIEDLVTSACAAHRNEWFHQTLDNHYRPLSRVIGSLPLPDMAALAESLIELQSLKERVTEPTESVGGPIDVAAISRHDGFVWIERKHYFRPELNPRFFLRQQLSGHV